MSGLHKRQQHTHISTHTYIHTYVSYVTTPFYQPQHHHTTDTRSLYNNMWTDVHKLHNRSLKSKKHAHTPKKEHAPLNRPSTTTTTKRQDAARSLCQLLLNSSIGSWITPQIFHHGLGQHLAETHPVGMDEYYSYAPFPIPIH